MKVTKIREQLIKPHTPTPQNLKNYHLSFIDEIMPLKKFSVILFYQSKPEKEMQLEESLAKILVEFYPLAGRYVRNGHLIDCNDKGAMFIEAEALDVELKTDLVVKNMEIHNHNDLIPDQDFPCDDLNPLLSIQATHFQYGGLAITIAVSHRVFDASSLGTFISAWSNATNQDGKVVLTPSFNIPSFLPYKDRDSSNDMIPLIKDETIVGKRFFFDKASLMRLRSKLNPNRNGKIPSRVCVVCAVIAEALIHLDKAKHGKTRDFLISQPINMRGRTITTLQNHACGNLIVLSITRCVAASKGEEIGMQELVDLMDDAVEKSIIDHAQLLCRDIDGRDIFNIMWEKLMMQLSNVDKNVVCFTDWSKFGFYEADFGWGKPVFVSIRPIVLTNITILMSSRDGYGIGAWVYLKQDDMQYLEKDEEIKNFMIK